MNQKQIIVLVIIVLLLLGLTALYFFYRRDTDKKKAETVLEVVSGVAVTPVTQTPIIKPLSEPITIKPIFT